MVAQRTEREYEGKKWSKDEVGVGGMNCECSTDIYIPPSVKQISSGKLLHGTGELSSALCHDQEGWDEEMRGSPKREGTRV